MPFVQAAYPNRLLCMFDGNGYSLPCSVVTFTKSPLRHGCPKCHEDDPLPFGAVPAVVPILCWSCGANLIDAITGVHAEQVNDANTFVEKIYRATLRGASPRPALLGEVSGTQFRRFVDDLFLLLAWYPSAELAPRLTDPRNLHLHFGGEILSIIAALIVNVVPATEPGERNGKYVEGLTLWLRVLALLSPREEERIEDASDLWPPALRQRLNAALAQPERSRSSSSPFRSRFFRPGLKYINSFEFRDLSAVNELDQRKSGI